MLRILGLSAVVLILGLIVFGLGRQIVLALQAGQRLDRAAEEVNNLQQDNRVLKEKLSQTQKYNFIEQMARDKLNLVKPGETVVIIPEKAIDKVLSAQIKVEEVKLPNWQGWLKLFTH
jgi:cell division protein FtsB